MPCFITDPDFSWTICDRRKIYQDQVLRTLQWQGFPHKSIPRPPELNLRGTFEYLIRSIIIPLISSAYNYTQPSADVSHSYRQGVGRRLD